MFGLYVETRFAVPFLWLLDILNCHGVVRLKADAGNHHLMVRRMLRL